MTLIQNTDPQKEDFQNNLKGIIIVSEYHKRKLEAIINL